MNVELNDRMVEALLFELKEKQKLIDDMRREINMLHAHIQDLEGDQEEEQQVQYYSLNDPLKGKM